MTDHSFQFPKFFVTSPMPCPYLEGRMERKVFTDLNAGESDALNEALGRVGFRRSQAVAYRPACEGCSACRSVRVLTDDFHLTRSMRRTHSKNRDLKSLASDYIATHEQYALLKTYLEDRHPGGGMSGMDEFEYAEMVESSPVSTILVEYREPPGDNDGLKPGKLVGVALTDLMSDGLSMVYSFYDTRSTRTGLGTMIILDHIERARKASLPYVYLGYWIKGSDKMDYKRRFTPLEVLGEAGWTRLED